MKKFIYIFILVLFSFAAVPAQNYPLNDGWLFTEAGKQQWKPAFVPGNVHLDLQLNDVIKDPTVADNFTACKWVETKDWEYQCSFSYPDALHFSNNELVFEGLDTYADVYLNDSLVLRTDNMFRAYIVQVKPLIRESGNTLRILFHSTASMTKKAVADAGITYPAFNDASYPFTRKEAIQYGWDFTQRQLTCGIWRPVTLRCWNDFIIRDLHAVQKKLDGGEALMEAVVEVESRVDDTLRFDLVKDLTSMNVLVKKGMNTVVLPYTVMNPKRWWPNGMGEQKLYTLYVQVTNKTRFDWKQVQYGLRTLEVVNQKDGSGRNFYLVVNGIPVYMKGSNYIPQLNNYKQGYSNYSPDNLFTALRNCNMNMVRVWGGGIYESDEFYRLADLNGILVWQDFMFSGTMYPGDSAFLNNVEKEAVYNIKRLRNHPSLALWCGNNEVEVAWKNWGWQKAYKYNRQDSTRLWNDYKKLFEVLLPNKVAELDKGRFYFSSTPQSNWGKKEDLAFGDNHYWGVWHGGENFDAYTTHIPRFASEFGFQSLPEVSSIKRFSSSTGWMNMAGQMPGHQFSKGGNDKISKMLLSHYRPAPGIESMVYLSQLGQAFGMKTAIEAQRRNMPYCMGSLVWQLNDIWPVASWSTIDYYGKWKAAQFVIKKAYAQQLLSPYLENNNMKIQGINDAVKSVKGSLVITVMKTDGGIANEILQPVELPAGKSVLLYNDSLKHLCKGAKPGECFLVVRLINDTSIISMNTFYFTEPKELLLQKPQYNYSFTKEGSLAVMILSVDVPALGVCVSVEGQDMLNGRSDNYFDLLPGMQKVLYFYSDKTPEELKKMTRIRSLRDTY